MTISPTTPVTNGADVTTANPLPVTIVGGSVGTVTSVAVVTNAGISGSVATPTTTPAITLSVATQATGDNTTNAATTAFVTTAIANAIAGVNPAVSVNAATTVAGDTSGLTYNNGVSGVGATLTGTANTAITIDGFTFTAVGQRLLVKNDTQSPSGAFNGVYTMTVLQALGVAPVFTRAADYNSPGDINNTGAIPVISGTANALTSWLLTSTVTTVGSDALTYVQFTFSGSASAGAGGTTASGSVVLTSASVGAQGITTTAYGQSVTLPDATTMTKAANNFNISNLGGYPLKALDNASNILGFIYPGDSSMIGCADKSTAAGVWTCTGLEGIAITALLQSATITALTGIKYVALDSDRTLITFGSGANNLVAVVYRQSDNSFGAPTTVRSGAGNHIALKSATDQVLVCSCSTTTAFQAVVLSFSGTTITVNTAATATNAANIVANSFYSLIAVGGAFVVAYATAGPLNKIRSLSISGTTVTISTNEISLDGTATNFVALYAVTSSTMLAISMITTTSLRTMVYTISGSSDPAAGTGTTTASTTIGGFRSLPISSGTRWAVLYQDSASTNSGGIISVSGTVSIISTAVTTTSNTDPTANITGSDMFVSGSKLVVCASQGIINILTDSAGTASAGTQVTTGAMSGVNALLASGNTARFVGGTSTLSTFVSFDFSGSSPVLGYFAKLTMGTNGFPVTNTPPSNARYPAVFGGTRSYVVGIQAGQLDSRTPRVVGTALDAPPNKMLQLDVLSTPGTLSVAGSRTNESWAYTTVVTTGVGQITRVESVT